MQLMNKYISLPSKRFVEIIKHFMRINRLRELSGNT
jgi:hypothetical protein